MFFNIYSTYALGGYRPVGCTPYYSSLAYLADHLGSVNYGGYSYPGFGRYTYPGRYVNTFFSYGAPVYNYASSWGGPAGFSYYMGFGPCFGFGGSYYPSYYDSPNSYGDNYGDPGSGGETDGSYRAGGADDDRDWPDRDYRGRDAERGAKTKAADEVATGDEDAAAAKWSETPAVKGLKELVAQDGTGLKLELDEGKKEIRLEIDSAADGFDNYNSFMGNSDHVIQLVNLIRALPGGTKLLVGPNGREFTDLQTITDNQIFIALEEEGPAGAGADIGAGATPEVRLEPADYPAAVTIFVSDIGGDGKAVGRPKIEGVSRRGDGSYVVDIVYDSSFAAGEIKATDEAVSGLVARLKWLQKSGNNSIAVCSRVIDFSKDGAADEFVKAVKDQCSIGGEPEPGSGSAADATGGDAAGGGAAPPPEALTLVGRQTEGAGAEACEAEGVEI